jgi:GT2 family glycosyltransferase
MANVGIIVVSYRTDPEPLFNSIAASRHEVRWYLFVHGQDLRLRGKLDRFAASTNTCYFPYGVNRGLARSWNEGLLASFGDRNDVTIILNDDLFFYDGAFDEFIDFILSEKRRLPDFAVVMTTGVESQKSDGGNVQKRVLTLGACFAIGEGAVERVGYFDENFWPAYFEDFDYHYRLGLAAAPLLWDERTLLEHQRSATVRRDRLIGLLHPERLRRNEQYYVRKWGGLPDKETYVHPFNDEHRSFYLPVGNGAETASQCGQYDRTDLCSAKSLGLLERSFSEELLAILYRHGGGSRRYLAWGSGEGTPVLAEFARTNGAELCLSIDDDAGRLRQAAGNTPKYSFVHFRLIDGRNPIEETAAGRAETGYVTYPLSLGVQFDLILIAGRWRTECALLAMRVLTPNGLIVLHDEERVHHRALRRFLEDGGIESGDDSAAVFDAWTEARDCVFHEVYQTVEERGRFLVLRPKQREWALRQRSGASG